ncbi:MAG TPA: hypothetical protein VGV09_19320 [Steroidobacteraceae bacterium]|nr:hypothetical protein [Steroidobacteraceae bacterium]
MNDNDGPDLLRLFAGYDPVIPADQFLGQTLAVLNREMRRARVQSLISYVLSALMIVALVAVTAAPLNAFMHTLQLRLDTAAGGLSPVQSQVLIYAVTLGLVALARRRLGAFLAPW